MINITNKLMTYAVICLFAALLSVSVVSPVGVSSDAVPSIAIVKKKVNAIDLNCLAQNIYHEANNQSELGKVAVGVVTLNRTQDRNFPKSVCGVVQQSSVDANGSQVCQFSWVCAGKGLPSPSKSWSDSLRIARMLLEGGYEQNRKMFDNVKYFHMASLKTNWSKTHVVVAQIGDHIFYK